MSTAGNSASAATSIKCEYLEGKVGIAIVLSDDAGGMVVVVRISCCALAPGARASHPDRCRSFNLCAVLGELCR